MMCLIQMTNQTAILGALPESLGLLIFGIGLIVTAIVMRWLFTKFEPISQSKARETSGTPKG
jgi:hypothetical protein